MKMWCDRSLSSPLVGINFKANFSGFFTAYTKHIKIKKEVKVITLLVYLFVNLKQKVVSGILDKNLDTITEI
jgi:hypothetical protein